MRKGLWVYLQAFSVVPVCTATVPIILWMSANTKCTFPNLMVMVLLPRFGDVLSSADLPSWKQAKCGPGTAGQLFTSPTSNKELLNTVNKASVRPTTVSSTTKGKLFQFHLIFSTFFYHDHVFTMGHRGNFKSWNAFDYLVNTRV